MAGYAGVEPSDRLWIVIAHTVLAVVKDSKKSRSRRACAHHLDRMRDRAELVSKLWLRCWTDSVRPRRPNRHHSQVVLLPPIFLLHSSPHLDDRKAVDATCCEICYSRRGSILFPAYGSTFELTILMVQARQFVVGIIAGKELIAEQLLSA